MVLLTTELQVLRFAQNDSVQVFLGSFLVFDKSLIPLLD